jgi:hypothetical protein
MLSLFYTVRLGIIFFYLGEAFLMSKLITYCRVTVPNP